LATFIFIVSASLMLQRFTDPWTRIDDANSLIYSFYAKNLLRYPASIHKLLNIDAVSQPAQAQISGEPFSYYLDHSPMLTYLVAGSYWLLGISEWTARLVPLLSSLGSLITLFFFVWRWIKSFWISLTSLIVMAFAPLFVEQAQIVNFEPPTLFFSLLASYLLIEGYWQKRRFFKFGGYLTWFLAMLIDWPATFIALPLFLLIFFKKRNWELGLPILLPLLANGFIFWLNSRVAPHLFSALLSAVFFKPNSYSLLSAYPSLLPTFFQTQLNFLISNYTIFPLIGAFLWLVLKWRNRRLSAIEVLALFFLAVDGLNVILFPSWSSTHRYWTYYLLPFLAVTTGLTIDFLRKKLGGMVVVALGIISLFLFLRTSISIAQERIWALETTPEQIAKMELLDQTLAPDAVLYTTKNIYLLGPGRRVRYYVDRPIRIVSQEDLSADTFPMIMDRNDSVLLDEKLSINSFPFDYQLVYLEKQNN